MSFNITEPSSRLRTTLGVLTLAILIATMLVAAGSAFIQGHLNGTDRNPLHRTLFSLASLVIALQASGLAFHLLGGGSAATAISTMARRLSFIRLPAFEGSP